MDQKHVIYGLSEEERELIPRGESYLEIWAGLPEVKFEPSESTGGQMGLHHKSRDLYIWVPPPAAKAISRNPQTLLMVSGDKKGERLDRSPRRSFYWLDLPSDYMYGRDLEEFVCNVADSNYKTMLPTIIGRKKQELCSTFERELESLTRDNPTFRERAEYFVSAADAVVKLRSEEDVDHLRNYFRKVLGNIQDYRENHPDGSEVTSELLEGIVVRSLYPLKVRIATDPLPAVRLRVVSGSDRHVN